MPHSLTERNRHPVTGDCTDIKISVVIPTYKRPRQLLQGLVSLQHQTLQEFEIVVVDNAGGSDIRDLVADFNRENRVPVRYCAEPEIGLHNARHAGARMSKGNVVVFTDDDATFDQDWLRTYADAFAEHPSMAAAGGPVRPVWEFSPPEWLQKFYRNQTIFPILSLMELHKGFSISPDGFFFGVNMAIRRSVLFEVGGFNPEAFGDVWLGNGETGLNHKLWERGLLVGYVPDAIVHHHIPMERMTVEYFRRRMGNEGACDVYTRFHRHIPSRLKLRWHAASIILRNIVFWLIAGVVTGRTDWFSLRLQLQAERAYSQLQYVFRLMRDDTFRQFVARKDWLNT